MFHVYILRSSKTLRYYTGYCEDLSNRLDEHNSGENKSTKAGIPWQLVHSEVFSTKSEAIRKEHSIKSRGAGRYLRDLGTLPIG